jgi:prolyl-tRNA synthetase
MAKSQTPPRLTPQAVDFPRWYQDILELAELADNGPVRGTMVIRPYGYGIWERIQTEIDARIKLAGAQNMYMPLFIPDSYLKREAQHVEGFSPELAVVTHAGGKELAEPVVVRPTSETLFGHFMSKWVSSHRDLPMLLNQWCNVVRWELRPRVFLRTSEFLWQEGHTAHSSREDASLYARRIHLGVYRDFFEKVLALPVHVGVKTAAERFAGAINSLTCEGLMRDGKALQMATSHELGQNFAKAFEIRYLNSAGELTHAWTTSWGSSTRILGGLIMAHGDDAGLMLPPVLAPIQVVILVVQDESTATEAAERLIQALREKGIRVAMDTRTDQRYGRRVVDWELKGVPLRVEIGPRDLASGVVTIARRDERSKDSVSSDQAVTHVEKLIAEIQASVFRSAQKRLGDATVETTSVAEAREAARTGLARIPWRLLGLEGERELQSDAITVRCLQTEDGHIPDDSSEHQELYAIVGRSY